ncbi:hypothetical protein O181_070678 [Austropuccinia psidii MF-1]|uniref:Uncharacterized protein n=1 Tax=Austropuccinia psidii MF-1 TaxID=1389203 RepID=A0A9Q3I7H5_9BASI|nr:hypothetical protein [Austropuccinia psidii MF-1]
MLVMLADKHTRNACLLSNRSDHGARGVPTQDALARTPLTKPTKSPPTRLTRSIYALQASPAATHYWPKDLSRKPSQHDEPPIHGPSPSSKPPEDVATREAEQELAPTQSMEEPFACSATPRFVIIIDDTPVGCPPPISPSPTPPPSTPTPVPSLDLPPIASSPQCPAPLIPTMTLARNSLTCDQH